MGKPTGFDDISTIGSVSFCGCKMAEPDGIQISVCEAWDDITPRRFIVLCVSTGLHAAEFNMDVDKAEALGLLLCSAARGMRDMSRRLDEGAADD